MRIALYARVSTTEQDADLQLVELRRYAAARGWEITGEFVDRGVSGTATASLLGVEAAAGPPGWAAMAVTILYFAGKELFEYSQDRDFQHGRIVTLIDVHRKELLGR